MPDKKRTAGLDWEDLRYFVALARNGTLSATARGLRVNHATVARRVASLEGAVGRPLFDRRKMPTTGWDAVTVPGAVSAWVCSLSASESCLAETNGEAF